MILTTCAACAAPLAHNAPRCVRCWTRYCDATCQHDLTAATNYSSSLLSLKRFEEAKSILSKATRVARRALGEDHIRTLQLRWNCGLALHADPDATLDDLREAVTTLQETAKTTRQVYGGAHPLTVEIEASLQAACAKLRARETPPANA